MLKQISLIAIAIGIATVLIAGTNHANAALRATQPPQTLLSAGHDQIIRSSTGILLKVGADSINLPLQQRAMLAEATK